MYPVSGAGRTVNGNVFIIVTGCIADNLKCIRGHIDAAAARAGRDPASVTLVAVTKTVGTEEIRALHALGVRDMGENRLEAARPKIEAAPDDLRWHFIAPIQSRKAREVVALFSVADAVDRVKVARVLQQRCEEQERTLEILLEVNVTGEAAKHGFSLEETPAAIREIEAFDRLRLTGLMTMAPFGAPEPVLRACFRQLKAMCDNAGLPECSMGMSDDFEIAVEEGATQVRIGTALFA